MNDPRGPKVPAVVSHFQVESLLGAGGMGTVYLGVDRRDGTLVAIKLLHPHLTDPSFRERFEREAHVAALLRSPYTVHILDYGVVDGRYFIAMEYIDGETLGQALRDGPLPVERALRIAAQVARALEEAQARGVVHRDIKPENVLLWAEDAVKVSDFGIARQSGAATLTVPGAFYGTLAYAAPEQFVGEADHRSDIYALGATLYHMLAGRPPFSGSFEEIQREIVEKPLPLEPLNGFDDTVVGIVSRCLEKDPERRYQSASELAAALERAARGSTAPPSEQPRRAPSAPTEALGTAAAAGREALSMRLGPPRTGFPFTARLRSVKYELAIQNECDDQLDLELRAEDRGGRCRFKLPQRISIAPHGALRLSLRVRPKKRRWRGDREVRVFTVYASTGDGQPPFTVSGRFDDLPFGWVPYGGVVAAGIAAAAVAGGALAAGLIGPEPGPEPSTRLYIALGDSLSRGVGGGVMERGGFVPLVRAALPGFDLLNLSVSGHTSLDLTEQQLDPAAAEIDRRKNDGIDANEVGAVSLGIGGNDFLDFYFGSVQTGVCPNVQAGLLQPECVGALRAMLDEYRLNAHAIVQRLRGADPELPLFLMTLYNPFPTEDEEAAAMAELALEGMPSTQFPEGMNDIIRAEAAAGGAHVAEVYPLFQGRELELVSSDGVHPNQAGYDAIAAAFIEAMRGAGLPVLD